MSEEWRIAVWLAAERNIKSNLSNSLRENVAGSGLGALWSLGWLLKPQALSLSTSFERWGLWIGINFYGWMLTSVSLRWKDASDGEHITLSLDTLRIGRLFLGVYSLWFLVSCQLETSYSHLREGDISWNINSIGLGCRQACRTFSWLAM